MRTSGKTVTKKYLVECVSQRLGQPREQVRDVLQALLDCVTGELAAGNRIEFRDFGVFEVRARAARLAQNPKTLERVPVPARRTVRFKVGRLMRERIDEPGAAAKATPGVEFPGRRSPRSAS